MGPRAVPTPQLSPVERRGVQVGALPAAVLLCTQGRQQGSDEQVVRLARQAAQHTWACPRGKRNVATALQCRVGHCLLARHSLHVTIHTGFRAHKQGTSH